MGVVSGLKRFILWDYPRAGWQYDVIVASILAFIFLTPRDFFRDQPKASRVVMLPSERGTSVYWIEPELLAGVADPRLSPPGGSAAERPLWTKAHNCPIRTDL